MVKKLTNRKVILISATVMIVVLTLGFTLALWSRNFTQTGTNTITSDCFNIEYSENDATSLINSYPQTDEDGLKNVSYDVTIENTCNTVTNYSVVLNELSTNTLSESHVKVAVNDSYKMLNTYESATPSADVDNASSARLLTQGVLGPEQEKTISIKSWMDEDTTELEGENKTFGYKITIEANAGANDLLASKIFATNKYNSVAPTVAAFKYGEPTATPGISGYTYTYTTETNKNYSTQLSSSSANIALGNDFAFNENTGYFTLSGITTDMSFTSESIGKYACATNTNGNTFNNTGTNCVVVYKINNVNESGETKYITSADVYKTTSGTNTGSGLFSTQDDDGTSFYLRGEINNNYVSFAGKLWRVLRINGNGSIRLILQGNTGTAVKFNTSNDNSKYVGYTYDNTTSCTKENPCISDYDGDAIFTNNDEIGSGINSSIKTYLENWYHNNIGITYNSMITQESYCNDTTYRLFDGQYYYGSRDRVPNGVINLDCPNTNQNYGGYYKSQIGLISVDELVAVGCSNNGKTFNNSFCNGSYVTMSPYGGSYSYAGTYIFGAHYDTISGGLSNTSGLDVRPVINLVSNAKVASGNGTQSSPYVIDLN